MDVRIAHAADIHLGARPYHIVQREKDIYIAFHELIDKVIKERADYLILAGDIFQEPTPKNAARKVFRDALKELREKGVRVVGILGDHDVPRMYDIPPTADLASEEFQLLEASPRKRSSIGEFSINVIRNKRIDLAITGLCVRKYGKNENIGEDLRHAENLLKGHRIKVLVLHQAIKEKWPFDTSAIPMGMIPREVDYVAMGHIHNRFEMPWGNGKLAYPGSIEALRFNEWNNGEKGFYLVDLDGYSVETQFVKLESIRPQKIFRLGKDSPEDLIEFLEISRKRPVLHIVIPANMPREEYSKMLDDLGMVVPLESGRFLTVRKIFERNRSGEVGVSGVTPERVSLEDVIKEVDKERAELILQLLSWVNGVDEDKLEEELERIILEWVENEGKKG